MFCCSPLRGVFNVCQVVWPSQCTGELAWNASNGQNNARNPNACLLQIPPNRDHSLKYFKINDSALLHVCWILEMSNPQIREKLTGGDKSFCIWHETGDDVTTGPSLSWGQFLNVLPKKHMSENSCVTYTTIVFKLGPSDQMNLGYFVQISFLIPCCWVRGLLPESPAR